MPRTVMCFKPNILLLEESSDLTKSISQMIYLLQNTCNNFNFKWVKHISIFEKAINKWHCYKVTIFCFEILVSKGLENIETGQFIYNANKLTGFYMIQVFSEMYS